MCVCIPTQDLSRNICFINIKSKTNKNRPAESTFVHFKWLSLGPKILLTEFLPLFKTIYEVFFQDCHLLFIPVYSISAAIWPFCEKSKLAGSQTLNFWESNTPGEQCILFAKFSRWSMKNLLTVTVNMTVTQYMISLSGISPLTD